MSFFDYDKSILENIYLLSGPIIAILAMLVLLQIRIAKDTLKLAKDQINQAKHHLKTISNRESASIAANRVEFFVNTIIVAGNKLFFENDKRNSPIFNGDIKNFNHSEFNDWEKPFKDFFLKTAKNEAELIGMEIINHLESFAIYFTKGIADEQIAFSSVGNPYCHYVKTYYPLISFLRKDDSANKPFQNLISLYSIWNERIDSFEQEKVINDKEKTLSKEMEALQDLKKQNKINMKAPKPIGS